MNTNSLAKQYPDLTPEERFRLILAAGIRGDEAEQKRLIVSGNSLALTMNDHAPYAHAFSEVAHMVYLELLEDAHRYFDAFDRVQNSRDIPSTNDADDDLEESDQEVISDGDHCEPTITDRYFDLVLAAGYMLKTKAAGWSQFCQCLSIPPFGLWNDLPGCDRLEHALALAETAAFVPEGFLRWLNNTAPGGEEPLASVPMTAAGIAESIEASFRTRVAWWSG